MILRRVIVAAGAALACSVAPASSGPLTADRLPPSLLADCDARAEPLGRTAPTIAEAAAALIDIGAFSQKEFQDARIGFCALRSAGGPVAATSCGDGVILLDQKYAAASQTLNLRATLAHEMTHHLQHRDRKARFGDAYCASARYLADKAALEEEADAFGDKVAELFTLGRGVEIVNACDAPVSIYLEAENPIAVRGAEAAFQRVPAKGTATSTERALSGRFRYHARTMPTAGKAHVWEDRTSPQSRIVEGRLVRLKTLRLSASDRADSPFRLRLSCQRKTR